VTAKKTSVGAHAGAADRQARAAEILARLKREYTEPRCALDHVDAFQLLIATILSAQCTDERVNMVTPALFKRFPTARAMAAADPAELEELIRSTGFYRNKTKSILGASARITEVFGGKVPQTMEDLLTLPGVARKTANVVLGSAFGMNEGVVVDTHVQRLSQRMGLTKEHDPAKVERDLMELFPREEWTDLSHRLILHGRQVCNARLPRCEACVLGPDACPSYQPEAAGWKSGKAERAKKSASRMVGNRGAAVARGAGKKGAAEKKTSTRKSASRRRNG
jgi:endonuclease-3